MQQIQGGFSESHAFVSEHVESDAATQGFLGADTVNGFLHFPMPAIGALHRVGSGFQSLVVQEGQSLVKVGGLDFGKDFAQMSELLKSEAEPGKFGLSGVRPAAAIKEPIDFIHEASKGPDVSMQTRHDPQGSLIQGTEAVLDQQIAVLKEQSDPIAQALGLPGLTLLLQGGGTAAGKFWDLLDQLFTHFGQGA